MLELNVSQTLNQLPHRSVETPFPVWLKCYNYHVQRIFNIFFSELSDIEPFDSKNIDSEEFYQKFAEMLYKKSTRVV